MLSRWSFGATLASPPPIVARWLRPVAIALTILATAWGLVVLRVALNETGMRIIGLDFGHYLDGTNRWLADGTPYLAHEVAGSFEYSPLTFLHPPIALYLFAPFLVLPAILWWAIPIGFVAWSVYRWRPAVWSWPIIAGVLVTSRWHIPLIVGNTDLWVWAGVAGGLRFGWPAIVTVVKPSLLPLVLAGARHRSFWAAAIVTVLLAIPFGTLWLDWISVIRNSPAGLAYSLGNLPWLLTPVIAWFARARTLQPE